MPVFSHAVSNAHHALGDDRLLLAALKHAWLERGGVYGYRKLTVDMRDLGERCGKHRVARLLRIEGLRSQTWLSALLRTHTED